MTGRGNVRCRCAFTQHLQNGIAGNEVDQQKDNGHHQPQHRQRVEKPREQQLQGMFHVGEAASYGSRP